MEQYLRETRMLDYSNKSIQEFIEKQGWRNLDEYQRLKAIYNYQRCCPDDLLKEHHQEMSAIKAFAYRNLGRHLMNRNVRKIRNR